MRLLPIFLILLLSGLVPAQAAEDVDPAEVPEVVLPTLPNLPPQAAEQARVALDRALVNAKRALANARTAQGENSEHSREPGPSPDLLPTLPVLPEEADERAVQALDEALEVPNRVLEMLELKNYKALMDHFTGQDRDLPEDPDLPGRP